MRGELLVAWAAQQKSLDSSSAVNSQTVGNIPELVLILILLLLIATAVALVTQRLRISYVAGLVLAGLPITDLLSRRIGLDPFLVLNLFLPILIFEAAINTDISRLRSTFKPIALLAGPGSVFSAAIIAVFVSIWAMVILGAVFNALTITKPIKELLVGVKNIAAGNFKQRVDLPLGGELGELILSFNEMAEKLERYEEQNIEEMTAEKAKLDTLMSTIADGAILLDTNFQLLLINPAAREIFGWEDQEIIGQNVLHLFPSELTVKLTKPLYQIAAGETLQPEESANQNQKNAVIDQENNNYSPAEFRLSLTHPKPCTIRILLTQVFDQYRENVRGIAMTLQDITRETELNEAKSQFISNVSHELRTPLFNIKSFIETLTEFGEDLSDTEKREFLETANHETDRLTRLVNDVLDLSRLESSRNYNLDALDIGQLIEQTLRTYQLNARDKGLELSSEIEANLLPILGHYDLLLQVLTNLVGNSLKFTPAGGKVVIRAYKISKDNPQETLKIRVEVSDTGIGIDAEDQSAIFDRFYRVENRVHTLEGTGLGLSIVKNIIEKHYSQIHLISEVGIGTTFWFDLDLYQGSIASKKINDVSL